MSRFSRTYSSEDEMIDPSHILPLALELSRPIPGPSPVGDDPWPLP